MKKRWLCLCVIVFMLLALCGCDSDNANESKYDPNLFTQEYKNFGVFLQNYKNNYSSVYDSDIKNNESIKAFFNYSNRSLHNNQIMYDMLGANRMVDLLTLFEVDSFGQIAWGTIYLKGVKVGAHYEPLISLCEALQKSDFEEVIKVNLKNPESLQLHSVIMCIDNKNFLIEQFSDGKFYGSDVDFYADYSAQNGFGGMNREWCEIDYSFMNCTMKYGRKVQSYDILQYRSEASYVKTLF